MKPTFEFTHFEAFCIAEAARGEESFKAMLDAYFAQHPYFAQSLIEDFRANRERYEEMGKRLNMPRMLPRALEVAGAQLDHHLDTPPDDWRSAMRAEQDDPKDHTR